MFILAVVLSIASQLLAVNVMEASPVEGVIIFFVTLNALLAVNQTRGEKS